MIELLLLSMVCASLSFTITESVLFSDFRIYIRKRNSWLGELVSCGYCLGHWIAALLIIITGFNIFNTNLFIDYFFTALIIAWISSIQWLIMCYLMNKANK